MSEIEINYFNNLQNDFFEETGKTATAVLDEYLLWLNYRMFASIRDELYGVRREIEKLKQEIAKKDDKT